jgi:ketosteroid isomerase-like protein
MSSRFSVILATLVVSMFCSTSAHAAGAQQKPLTADQEQVVDTVTTMLAAVRTEDVAKFNSLVAPGFYLFDGGTRFDGHSIMDLIKAQYASGKRFEWSVTEPDVHINGNSAWIAYINKGSITDGSGTMNQQWLESAVLEKQQGSWKILFMQSTRVPKLPQQDDRK